MPGSKSSFPAAYQQKSRLHYYSHLFDTIEVNSCFYRTPLRSTYEKWAADVPDDFQFTLKLSRDITHAKELNSEMGSMEKFIQAADGAGAKKGCLLIQFPGKITLDHFSQVERILAAVEIYDPRQSWRPAIEFRNESWYVRETIELANEYKAAIVLHDFSKAKNVSLTSDAAFVYLRMHGPNGDYRDSYNTISIDEKADLVKDLSNSGKDVYVYFNNTAGNAFENARQLQKKLNRVNRGMKPIVD
jgi:uncharacterized protein YecE (DUF72 family)